MLSKFSLLLSWQAISKFESLVNQIQKNAKDIDARLKAVEQADLFKGPPSQMNGEILPGCKVRKTNLWQF